jgi:beta-galactosidase/beta-glucuronidase
MCLCVRLPTLQGNECGYGPTHDAMAAMLRAKDPSRPVHYEVLDCVCVCVCVCENVCILLSR